ncbi:MAG TPA: RIO1 family regulatory kinase/ATPase [Candidatus Limnocylindria bacterium]|nr:RIO1 family regulatory kinase/ATPase [Candidatus Limnocylindria bacterium]
MHPPNARPRPAPAWLVNEPYDDRPLGTLKTGKEAEVFVVERCYAGGSSVLLAHKRYRPRLPGKGELRELGFAHGTTYRNKSVYSAGWYLSSRDRRAVETHTDHGQDLVHRMWPVQEQHMLQRAWDAGASVPYPVERTADGVLMELIGDLDRAAPRLANARLTRADAASAWEQLRMSLRALAAAGVVHGDLSAYNLLWWQGRLVLIDLPQAVEFISNADAPDLLHRDIANVATWFGRHGVEIDVEEVFAELLAVAF